MLLPPAGPGIRYDSGSYEGWTVPMDYDPLLAKLIGYGSDREQATMRLQRALAEYFVGGIKTNIPLFRRILRDGDFQAARLDTGYLERLLGEPAVAPSSETAEVAAIAAAMFTVLESTASAASSSSDVSVGGNWKRAALREGLR